MSLKIKNDISSMKINGCYIKQAKINGYIVYELKGEVNITITYLNNEITVVSDKTGLYELYYANDREILSDYEKIYSFSLDANTPQKYTYFNELNIAPFDATRIVACDTNNNIVSSLDMPQELSLSLGDKLYSVGLLSDIHIDGNGDGNNSDSGNSQSDFRNALQYFNNKSVDFICICGDITYYGYDADYEAYKTLVNTYSNNIPIKAIRGNHECYVNGSSNYNDKNTKFQENVNDLYYEYIYNNDVYLFCGMYKESSTTPLSDDEFIWLSNKLEEYKNRRVFLFVHYYYGDVGNTNNIVSIHRPIDHKTFTYLITKYKNVIYFSGHTHLAFDTQKYGKYNNIKQSGDICHRVHIPSCSYPRKSPDGTKGSYKNYPASSEGCLMDVYENGILLKGINFETNKFLPIANYYLNTPIEAVEENPSSRMSTLWLDYNNPNVTKNSIRLYDSFASWMENLEGRNIINGIYLDLFVERPCEFKMTVNYITYVGAPTKYCVFILDSNNNDAIVNRYNYKFVGNGNYGDEINVETSTNVNLEKGNYKIVIGSDEDFEFGTILKQISLTELQNN